MGDEATLKDIARFRADMERELAPVLISQGRALEQTLCAVLAGGHVLLTGGAATAKGLLVLCLARAARLDFKRVQFTPDLMPSDITGTDILEEDAATGRRAQRFVPGPVFTNILMADEINRTPPKTQASLLEAMQEKQVTTGGSTRPLPKPFLVMATKTSVETDGTYALPEAQQDRFMLNVEMIEIDEDKEVEVVMTDPAARAAGIQQVVDAESLLRFQAAVRRITLPPAVRRMIVDLACSTRPGTPDATAEVTKYVAWGAGVRATQCLALCAKARAALGGRASATAEDVASIAPSALRHRIGLNFRAESDGVDIDALVARLIAHALTGTSAKPVATAGAST